MKKLLISISLLTALFAVPSSALADGAQGDQIECKPVYGGGVVCGVSPKKQPVVDTGIADNPIALGAILLGFAGSLFVVSKKLKASEIA